MWGHQSAVCINTPSACCECGAGGCYNTCQAIKRDVCPSLGPCPTLAARGSELTVVAINPVASVYGHAAERHGHITLAHIRVTARLLRVEAQRTNADVKPEAGGRDRGRNVAVSLEGAPLWGGRREFFCSHSLAHRLAVADCAIDHDAAPPCR